MLRYYGKLLRQLPRTLVEAGSAWLTIIGLAVAVLVAVGAISNSDVSPWLILVPVAVLVVFGLMRANWEEHDEANRKATRTDQAEELGKLLRQQLQDCEKRYAVSQAQYPVFKQFADDQERQGDG